MLDIAAAAGSTGRGGPTVTSSSALTSLPSSPAFSAYPFKTSQIERSLPLIPLDSTLTQAIIYLTNQTW